MEAGKYVGSGEVGSYHVLLLSKSFFFTGMKCCFRNSTLATGPNGVEAHLCLEMQMQCGEALFDLFPEVMSFGKCAASGCTLLDSPHLLKHEKKKLCA